MRMWRGCVQPAAGARNRKPIANRCAGLSLACVALAGTAVPALGSGQRKWPSTASAAPHLPCSTPHSASRPCYFSTASGNIHCLWTPTSQSVECELLASRRAYLLRPTGRARLVHVTLRHRGGTLPPGPYSLLFPQEVSCHATRTTVTYNQNYLAGYFYLAPRGSRSAYWRVRQKKNRAPP